MITGCLQQKSGFYYAVLYLKVNGRRRCKWVPMRLPVEGTSARKAQKAFDEIRLQYEREEEERLEREAKAKELAENTHPDALLPFTEYMEKWLQSTRSSLATATYQSYSNMIKARIRPYFAPLGLQLREVTPQHIENFYQSILFGYLIFIKRILLISSNAASGESLSLLRIMLWQVRRIFVKSSLVNVLVLERISFTFLSFSASSAVGIATTSTNSLGR